MNKDVMELWANALRSGKYKQGTKVLHCRDTNTYCCLGVLCELYVKENNLKLFTQEVMLNDADIVTRFGDSHSVLPWDVMEWSGIKCDNGGFKPTDELKEEPKLDRILLTSLNDGEYSKQYSFEEIATIIEQNWESL